MSRLHQCYGLCICKHGIPKGNIGVLGSLSLIFLSILPDVPLQFQWIEAHHNSHLIFPVNCAFICLLQIIVRIHEYDLSCLKKALVDGGDTIPCNNSACFIIIIIFLSFWSFIWIAYKHLIPILYRLPGPLDCIIKGEKVLILSNMKVIH